MSTVTTSTSFLIVGTSRIAGGVTEDQVVECIDFYLRNDASSGVNAFFGESTIGPAQLKGIEYKSMFKVIIRLLGDTVYLNDAYTISAKNPLQTIFSKPSHLKLPGIDESLVIGEGESALNAEAIVFAFVLLSIIATRTDPTQTTQPYTNFEFSKNMPIPQPLPSQPLNAYTRWSNSPENAADPEDNLSTNNNVYYDVASGTNADVVKLQNYDSLGEKAKSFLEDATSRGIYRSLYVFKQIQTAEGVSTIGFLKDAPSVVDTLFTVNMENVDVGELATSGKLRVKPNNDGLGFSSLISVPSNWNEYYRLALLTNLDPPSS